MTVIHPTMRFNNMRVPNFLYIAFYFCLSLAKTDYAQPVVLQDGSTSRSEIPEGLAFSYIPSSSMSGVDATLENKTPKEIAAYVYEGTCASGLHTRGYTDSAVTYSRMLEPGKSRALVHIDTGCKLSITAAIFSDGTEVGSPQDIRFLSARRRIAVIELRSILTEAYKADGNQKLDLYALARIVKAHRDGLPKIDGDLAQEVLTREHVIDQLDSMVAALNRYPATSDAMRNEQIESLQYVTQSWVAVLERKSYPKRRLHLSMGNAHE